MNRLNSFNLFLILALLFTVSACGGDDDDSNGLGLDDLETGTLSFKIDGTTFSTTIGNGAYARIDSIGVNTLVISGLENISDPFPPQVTIGIFSPVDTDISATTYTFTAEDCASGLNEVCGLFTYNIPNEDGTEIITWSTGDTNGSFQVTFSELDLQPGGKAVGTFTGDAVRINDGTTGSITEGKFNVTVF